jgi:hypothetical protein
LESTCVNPPLHTESAAPPYLDTLCPCFQSIIWSSEASPTVHSLPSSTVSKIEIQIIAAYECFVEADWLLWNTLTTSLLSQIFGLDVTSDPTYLDCSPIVNRGARGTFVSTHFSIWPLLFHWHLPLETTQRVILLILDPIKVHRVLCAFKTSCQHTKSCHMTIWCFKRGLAESVPGDIAGHSAVHHW